MITVNQILECLPEDRRSKVALAELFDVSLQAISQWGNDNPIPPKQELKLRLELMPEVFGFGIEPSRRTKKAS
jgi:hypothetical protein